MKLDSCFSFMRGAKSANSKLFKDFCNEAEMEKNSQIVGFILTSSRNQRKIPELKTFRKSGCIYILTTSNIVFIL